MATLEVSEMLILEALGSSEGDIRPESCVISSEMSFGSMIDSRTSDVSDIIAEDGGEG